VRLMLAVASVALMLPVQAQDEEKEKEPKEHKSFKGKTPPELASDAANWVNGGKDVPKLEKLRGRVVWLEFSYGDAAPSKAMKALLTKWHNDLGEKGLTVLEITNGGDKKKVEKSLAEFKAKYPALWDKGGTNCKAYGIKVYPIAYLIGVDGTVVWEGFPKPTDPELEKLVAKELARVKPAEAKEPPKEPAPQEPPKEPPK
jgi:AhpC/TSA family